MGWEIEELESKTFGDEVEVDRVKKALNAKTAKPLA